MMTPLSSRYRSMLAAGVVAALLVGIAPRVNATGESTCLVFLHQWQAGELASSGGFLVGARATIEGQQLPLCNDSGQGYPSGSFHWAALANVDENLDDLGLNIVQLGYGRCLRVNNDAMFGSTNCNGQYYWYWAWGSHCAPGAINGTGGSSGPIPIRIGAALGNTPPTANVYVVRELVGGVSYYDGYVNGNLLVGLDAKGNTRTARVAASSICWNSQSLGRRLVWFGETFNLGDSMGGWVNGVKNHLDYDPLRYSYNTGWKVPALPAGNPCNAGSSNPLYTCWIAERDHLYVDTNP